MSVALRKFSGFGDYFDDDEDDCDDDRNGRRSHKKSFEVKVRWVIRQGNTVVRVIEKTVDVRPPLQVINLPTRFRFMTKKFVLLPLELSWDGRRSNGDLAFPATYKWEAEALFTRVHTHQRFGHEKLVDESSAVNGTCTIKAVEVPPPTISITQPQNGGFLAAAVVAVTGTVSGVPPLHVVVNGTTAAVGSSTFAGSAQLGEGANSITASVTDSLGRSSQAAITLTRDSRPPTVSISSPPSGSTTSSSIPRIVIEYSDSSSGIDTSTLEWTLDGASLPGASTVTPDRAVIVPGVALSEGPHVFDAFVKDRAGNRSAARSHFTVVAGKPAPPSVDPSPAVTNVPLLTLHGGKPANTALVVDGVERIAVNASSTWSITMTLLEGSNRLTLQTRSSTGIPSDATTVNVTLDTVPPAAPAVSPMAMDVITPNVTINGTKSAGAAIAINGVIVVPADGSTTWSAPVQLHPGPNALIVESVDAAGNRSSTESGVQMSIASQKPVIRDLTVTPAVAPAGQSVTITYRLFAQVPPLESANLRVRISIDDAQDGVRALFDGVQQASPVGVAYSITWDGKNDLGQPVPVNSSYRITVSADREGVTTQPPQLVDANPKETAVTITGSQQARSSDGKLRIVFRPDDANVTIESASSLTVQQARVLARRQIRPALRPYRINVDRPFASRVVGLMNAPESIGRSLRAYRWDIGQQDWLQVSQTNWNPTERLLQFAIPGKGLLLIGSPPDLEAPRIASLSTAAGATMIRIADRDSGINPARTRVRCRGTDITSTAVARNLNGTREQLLTTTEPAARAGELLLYLEDWAGNGRVHRLKGGSR